MSFLPVPIQGNTETKLDELPPDMLYEITRNLRDSKDVQSLGMVNKYLQEALSQKRVYENIIFSLENIEALKKALKEGGQLDFIHILHIFDKPDIRDWCPIKRFMGVEELNIQKCHMPIVLDLRELTKLVKLVLYNNSIEDITLLEKIPWIKELSLGQNKIEDLGPLEKLLELTSLSLINCNKGGAQTTFHWDDDSEPIDITVIGKFTKLKFLDLSSLSLKDIKPLEDLFDLEILVLNRNLIQDLGPLAKLENLKQLSLAYNKVENIEALKDLENLQWLNLNFNSIEDIKPLEGLKKLETLELSNNQIKWVKVLTLLTNLKSVDLTENPLEKDNQLIRRKLKFIDDLKLSEPIEWVYDDDNWGGDDWD